MIRPIANQDFEHWLQLWEAYNTFYQRTVPMDVTTETWRRFLDPIEPMHALVFVRDDKILGLAHFLYHRHTASLGYSCYLQDLYTVETRRGEGIGKLLIEAVLQKANQEGTRNIYWHTHETNSTARKLYDHVANNTGFIVYQKKGEPLNTK